MTTTIDLPTIVSDPLNNGMERSNAVRGHMTRYRDEHTVDPVLGVGITDFDCDSTQSWVLVAHHPEAPTLLVELVEFQSTGYTGGYWSLVECIEVDGLADAVAAALALHDDYLVALRMRED